MSQEQSSLDRYVRQMRYPPMGEEGQQKLSQARALICGCGALGSVLANTLARAGVGHLRLVDRDFLETNNLQRQVLYDEQDVAAGIPKAIAAQKRLQKSQVIYLETNSSPSRRARRAKRFAKFSWKPGVISPQSFTSGSYWIGPSRCPS